MCGIRAVECRASGSEMAGPGFSVFAERRTKAAEPGWGACRPYSNQAGGVCS